MLDRNLVGMVSGNLARESSGNQEAKDRTMRAKLSSRACRPPELIVSPSLMSFSPETDTKTVGELCVLRFGF